jgi:DNA-binding ferritin-like protein (Dps family)
MKETDVKWRDERTRYKQYEARKKQLPVGHPQAIEAVERYARRFGPATGEAVVTMLEDLAEIFDQGTKDGPGVRGIVGSDPARFTEDVPRELPGQVVGRHGAAAPGPQHRPRGTSGGLTT